MPTAPHAYISLDGLQVESDDCCEHCGRWQPDLVGFDGGAILMCCHCAGVDPTNWRTARRLRADRQRRESALPFLSILIRNAS